MPVLVFAISENLDELFENCIVAAMASLSESRRVMVMAVYVSVVIIVAILGTEYGWTDGASEMLNVVFTVEGGYVGSTESVPARVTDEIKAPKIVLFAQRVLIWAFIGNRKELGGDNLATFLDHLLV